MREPALALLELGSIARAFRTGDAMVKRAEVRVAMAEAVSPGNYLILISGGVAEVEESWRAGLADGGDAVVDSLYLPGAATPAVDAVHGVFGARGVDEALAVLETRSVAATVVACDAAVKEAPVRVTAMRLARGIGGRGVFVLGGALWDIEAAVEAARRAIEDRRCLLGCEVVPRPDPGFPGAL